jgi:hypothetical protein
MIELPKNVDFYCPSCNYSFVRVIFLAKAWHDQQDDPMSIIHAYNAIFLTKDMQKKNYMEGAQIILSTPTLKLPPKFKKDATRTQL